MRNTNSSLQVNKTSDRTLPVYSPREKGLQLHCGLGRNMDDRKVQPVIRAETMFPLLQAYITIRLALEKREDE